MPRKATRETIQCRYFSWRIFQNEFGVWYADGRGNKPSAGRHSLETKEKVESLAALRELDTAMAVKFGLADASAVLGRETPRLSLSEGIEAYTEHVSRPLAAGGTRPATRKRYRAVFDKFKMFAAEAKIESWDEVGTRNLGRYASWLESLDYAHRTLYLELTTLKQAIGWLRREGLLKTETRIDLKLTKARESPTYCYSQSEFQAIREQCYAQDETAWLGDLVTALGLTGMRIGEAVQLEWADIDFDTGLIHIRDESRGGPTVAGRGPRTTKSGRGRRIALHRDLRSLLEGVKRPRRDLVFRGPQGGRVKPDTARNIFIREIIGPAADKLYPGDASHPFRRARLHSFRHFFCSNCFRAGVSEQQILDWMGHQDSSITRLYRHLTEADHLRAIDRLPRVQPTAELEQDHED
jgi:integrase